MDTENQAAKQMADRRIDVFIEEYVGICKELEKCCGEDEKGYFYQTLVELIAEIAEYLAPDNMKERVRAVRSDVIKTQAQIILEQGIEQGETKWRMAEKKILHSVLLIWECRPRRLHRWSKLV